MPSDIEPLNNLRRDVSPISLDEVVNALDTSKAFGATGPDGFPLAVVKACSQSLAPIMAEMYSACLMRGFHRPLWKEALIVPCQNRLTLGQDQSHVPDKSIGTLGKIMEVIVTRRLTY